MADVPPDPDSNGDKGDNSGVGPGRGSTDESTPRWVYVFGIIFIVLVLLFAILHLSGHAPNHTH